MSMTETKREMNTMPAHHGGEKGTSVATLPERVALVTGAGRGIGAAEAVRLAQAGAKVAVLDLSEDHCWETVERVRDLGADAIAVGCDVARTDQVTRAITRVVEHFGRLDILVNNAGILRDNLLFRMSDDEWDAVISIHLKGSFLCAREAQKYMVKQRYGKIVMTSSISALGNRGQANYAAAKAGLQGLTRTMAIELGPFNINVNAVAPGWIETDMLIQAARGLGTSMDVLREQLAKEIPLRRLGQPQDIANVVVFLVSDEASYINGETIYVAGGPVGVF
jgi:3-oxoacyl-[acyl-carrier protein] reductase